MNLAKPKPIKERPPDLNQKQKAFIREYCICMNIEEAQRKVGYKQHHGNGRRILDDPRSAAELKRNQRKAAELANVHLAWVLSNIEKIAGVNFHDVRKFDEHGNFVGLDLQKMTREQTFAISEIGFDSEGRAKIKFHDKLAANRILKEHIEPPKPQRVRLEGRDGGPVEVIDGLGARLNAARQRVKGQRSGSGIS
jgi:phage terminase small subunit